MTTIKERLAAQAARVPATDGKAESSPAAPVSVAVDQAEAEFIPMCVPQQKLWAPEIPGYHTHWFMGSADRIAQAQRAGYTFVADDEIGLANKDLAGDGQPIGGDDLGTNVSRIAGGLYEGTNTAQRLYLMKIPDWLWEKQQEQLAQVNHRIAAVLRGDKHGIQAAGQDNTNRYRPQAELDKKRTLFHPKN